MHRLWDSGIIEREGGEDAWLAKVDAGPAGQGDADGTVEDWATESLLAAREAYQVPGRRIESSEKLGEAYYEKSLPVVEKRLRLAGVRLAGVLNEAFEK